MYFFFNIRRTCATLYRYTIALKNSHIGLNWSKPQEKLRSDIIFNIFWKMSNPTRQALSNFRYRSRGQVIECPPLVIRKTHVHMCATRAVQNDWQLIVTTNFFQISTWDRPLSPSRMPSWTARCPHSGHYGQSGCRQNTVSTTPAASVVSLNSLRLDCVGWNHVCFGCIGSVFIIRDHVGWSATN